MDESSTGHQRGRCFTGFPSVVAWIPDPLGAFLDELRTRLCSAPYLPTHLTLAASACLPDRIEERISRLSCFEVMLGEVRVLASSGVVALDVLSGHADLRAARELLATAGAAHFEPHLTLAHGVPRAELECVADSARLLWSARPVSSFQVEHVALVRNVAPLRWETLTEHRLAAATLLRTA